MSDTDTERSLTRPGRAVTARLVGAGYRFWRKLPRLTPRIYIDVTDPKRAETR